MQCEEIREQFADYVIDGLAEPNRQEVEMHLAACPACRLELNELKSLWTQLGTVPPAEPANDLRARFDLMMEAHREGARPPQKSWRRPVLEFAAAAALLIAGVAVGYRMHALPPANPELAELKTELAQTRQMVALSLMQQQSATDRLKGVSWSYRLQQPGADVLRALLDTLMHDPNVNVRLATVDALRQFGNEPVVRRGLVDAMNRQESPMVQIALIDLAVDLGEKESVNTLRGFARDQNVDPAVRVRAEKGVEELNR